jgi:hypothetical protein
MTCLIFYWNILKQSELSRLPGLFEAKTSFHGSLRVSALSSFRTYELDSVELHDVVNSNSPEHMQHLNCTWPWHGRTISTKKITLVKGTMWLKLPDWHRGADCVDTILNRPTRFQITRLRKLTKTQGKDISWGSQITGSSADPPKILNTPRN